MQYRVGVQQTWAPVHEREEGVLDMAHTIGTPTLRTCMHVQVGGVAFAHARCIHVFVCNVVNG